MTDKFHSLTVVLVENIRSDDQRLINAILQLKNVLTVEGNITDANSLMAESRARRHFASKLHDVFKEKPISESGE